MLKKGFTLIEILLVMGIIAILASIVLVAINPARQFAQARDTQRLSHINTILNAVGQRIADHRGIFEDGCVAGAIPSTTTLIKTSGYDIYTCLVPAYVSAMPIDPKIGHLGSQTDYDSGYAIFTDTATGRVTVSAPATEVSSGTLSVSR